MVDLVTSAADFKTQSATGLVVVDFFATWCGPCKMIAPVLDKFSKEYTQVKFLKVDVDELSEIAADFSISSMPTLLFLKDGEVVQKVVGANPNAIKAAIQKLI